jgi:hypothetical protein
MKTIDPNERVPTSGGLSGFSEGAEADGLARTLPYA